MNLDRPIGDLIPHEAPMIWLDRLLEWKPGFARCETTIEDDTPLVSGGQLSTVALLEYMAQAVAVCLGYGALRSGESVRVGMVIACRSFELLTESVAVGSLITVEAQSLREIDEVSNYACQVSHGITKIATASITLYHASEPPA